MALNTNGDVEEMVEPVEARNGGALMRTEELKKTYTTEEVETTALNGVSIEIRRGEFVAIMGPSGCGKSSLLNVLGMLDNPSNGKYQFLGSDVSRHSERQLANLRKRNIGFVFQSFNLIDELTVFENVELPLLNLGVSGAERKLRVTEALEKMQIMHRQKHFPQQLSGGQQQLVAVARALITRPRVIFADEPTDNLNSRQGAVIMTEEKVLQPLDFFVAPREERGAVELDCFNLQDVERAVVLKAIRKHGGNISHAARELGLTRTSLYRRIEKYGL